MAFDGKRLRGSRREGEAALQGITLAGTSLRRVWEQKAVEGGDEVGAAIALLKDFPLDNKVISADAGLLQAPFVRKVVEKKLHRLEQGQSAGIASGDCGLDRSATSLPSGRGLLHQRSRLAGTAEVVDMGLWGIERLLRRAVGWTGVQWCGWIERKGKEETSLHVWLAGAAFRWQLTAAQALAHLRCDWTIENGVLRVCDVTFDEDRLHGRKIGLGLSAVRNVAITLLRQLGFRFIPDAQRAVAANPALAFALLGIEV